MRSRSSRRGSGLPGAKPALSREDVEAFADKMLASGRKRGGTPGTALSARSVRLTIGRLSAAFELAVRDRKLVANPCQYVELPDLDEREHDTWSAEQVRLFLAFVWEDRLQAAWRLSLYGLRRAEVCGLRWADVALDAGTITVANTRVVVYGAGIVTKEPKSRRGVRTLPLTAADVAAFQALHDRQVTEAMEAGEAYEVSGYVLTDELGQPVNPE